RTRHCLRTRRSDRQLPRPRREPRHRRSPVAVTGRGTSRIHGVDIVSAGTPDAAVPALEAFAESEHRIRAVLTRPDAPIARRPALPPSPVKTRAVELGLDVIEAERLRGEVITRLQEKEVDAVAVVAYGAIAGPAALSTS